MTKSEALKKEYSKIRSNYLARLRRANKEYHINKEKYTPHIPKRITHGSIRNIKKFIKKLTEEIHRIKVDTGYYTHQQHRRDALKFNKSYEYEEGTQYKKNFRTRTFNGNTSFEVSKPKRELPVMSEITLDIFEIEMGNAEQFVSTVPWGRKYEEAVRRAGVEASEAFEGKLNEYFNYIKNNEKLRKMVSLNLWHNFHLNYDDLERFLYDFESENGVLIHIDHEEDYRLRKLIEVAFNIKIDSIDEDNEDTNGYDVFKGEVPEMI